MSDSTRVAVVFDTTTFMPVQTARNAVAAFINLLQPDDRFAILRYRGETRPVFPPTGLATYDDREVIDRATEAIVCLEPATRASDLASALGDAGTRLGCGVGAGGNVVLLASSDWNRGEDPLDDLPGVSVQSLAVENHCQQQTLEAVANASGGRYTFVAETDELMPSLLDVAERIGMAQILASGTRSASGGTPFPIVGRVPSGTDVATFLVFWGDPEVPYGPCSSRRFVTVELLDPDQKPVDLDPDWSADGFAVFTVPNPAPGSWSLAATYNGPGSLTFTDAVLA